MIELTVVVHAMTAAMRAARFPRNEPIEPAADTPEEILALVARADALLSGPEARTTGTMEMLRSAAGIGSAGRARCAPAVDDSLRDQAPGRWAGRDLTGIPPQQLGAWLADPEFAPPDGESASALLERIASWLRGVGEGRTVAVTHPAVARAVLVCALGLPAERFWNIEARPLSALRLRFSGRGWTLRL